MYITSPKKVTFRENDWNPAETDIDPECRAYNIGFRLVLELQKQ